MHGNIMLCRYGLQISVTATCSVLVLIAMVEIVKRQYQLLFSEVQSDEHARIHHTVSIGPPDISYCDVRCPGFDSDSRDCKTTISALIFRNAFLRACTDTSCCADRASRYQLLRRALSGFWQRCWRQMSPPARPASVSTQQIAWDVLHLQIVNLSIPT